jgi:hypothetical protein
MKILTAHREFLRKEVRSLRRRHKGDWMLRAIRGLLDRPGLLLLLLALLALNIALWGNYVLQGSQNEAPHRAIPGPANRP